MERHRCTLARGDDWQREADSPYAPRSGGVRSVDRLCKRRESAAGESRIAPEGDGGSHGAGREPMARRQTGGD